MIRIKNIRMIDKYMDRTDDVLIVGEKVELIGKSKIDAYLEKKASVTLREEDLKADMLKENGLCDDVFGDEKLLVIEGEGRYLSPSFVDLHFHLRNPGQEYKQTFEEASAACIRGGYTKVVAMANTKPIADHGEVLDAVSEGMKDLPLEVVQTCAVTVGLKGETLVDFETMRKKTFVFSDDGRNVDSADIMEKALERSKELDFIIMDHDEPESDMVIRNIELARNTGGRLHFCHISEKRSIDAITKAKEDGLNVTFEVSPHHIFSKDLSYRVNPPIGTQEDNEAIIAVIKDGRVDAIATDHAPHTEEDKQKGAPGIANIETAFGMVRKVLKKEGVSLQRQIELMSNAPSEILGADNRIREGGRADLVLFNDEEYKIDSQKFVTRSKNTPYDGWDAQGIIEYTIVGGKIYKNR
ncbi:MAG: dihydroorotase [Peptostreptococcaceae bacterium]|nr:dihydroorotase [Peptostreptococcaceae bacterium]